MLKALQDALNRALLIGKIKFPHQYTFSCLWMSQEMPFFSSPSQSTLDIHRMKIYSFRFTLYCVQLNAIGILLSWCFSFSALFLHFFLELRHPSLLSYTHTHIKFLMCQFNEEMNENQIEKFCREEWKWGKGMRKRCWKFNSIK